MNRLSYLFPFVLISVLIAVTCAFFVRTPAMAAPWPNGDLRGRWTPTPPSSWQPPPDSSWSTPITPSSQSPSRQPQTDPEMGARHVLYVMIGGIRGDMLWAAETPHLDQIVAQGAVHTELISGAWIQSTWSDPGYVSLLNGVWATKHGVYENDFRQHKLWQYPHFFTRLRESDPTITTASIAHRDTINDKIAPAAHTNTRITYRSDEQVVNRTAALLAQPYPPHVTVIELSEVDRAGHYCCFAPNNRGYQGAVKRADQQIGQLLQAMRGRPTFWQEDWLIIVAGNHGGIGTEHGGQTPEEQETLFVMANTGDVPYCKGWLRDRMTLVDVVPHIFDFLEIEVNPAWQLDGRVHPQCS